MNVLGFAAIIAGALALLSLSNNSGRSNLAWAVLIVCVGIVLVQLGFDQPLIHFHK